MGSTASIYIEHNSDKFKTHQDFVLYLKKNTSVRRKYEKDPPTFETLYSILFHYHQLDKEKVKRQMQKILESGVNPNQCNEIGWTALHYATMTNDVKVFQLLLDYGADFAAITKDGFLNWTVKRNNSIRDLIILFKSINLYKFVE
jgi:ankyrin repeat protein